MYNVYHILMMETCQAAMDTQNCMRCLLPKYDQKYCYYHSFQTNRLDYPEHLDAFREVCSKQPNFTKCLIVPKRIPKVPTKYVHKKLDSKYLENHLEVQLYLYLQEKKENNLENLLGPAFPDITRIENDTDPISLDIIWEKDRVDPNKRIPKINPYFIFSYENKNVLRGLTIFSLHQLSRFSSSNSQYLQIPEKDKNRAQKVLDIYLNMINFSQSYEYYAEMYVSQIIQKLRINNIYLEEDWLLNINKMSKLEDICRYSKIYLKQNLKIKAFEKFKNYKNDRFRLRIYIFHEWLRILSDNPPILVYWIFVKVFKMFSEEINRKYSNY